MTELPTDTVLDGPGRDPLIDDATAAALKAVYLTHAPQMRSDGINLTDSEIIDAVHDLVERGLFRIVADDDPVRLVPNEGAFALAVPPDKIRGQEKARAKRRLRRKLSRRR